MRWMNWLTGPGVAALALVLTMHAADGQQRAEARAEEPTTRPVLPASLKEAEQAIDLRTFPTLERSETFYQTRAKIGYGIAKAALAGDVEFYRTKLTEAGWKIDREDVSAEQQYGLLYCSKQGFGLGVSIVKDPNSGKMNAFVENYGNVDAQTVVRVPGLTPKQSQFNVAQYECDGNPDAIAAALREELKKLGWRDVLPYGGEAMSTPGVSHWIQFVQRGMSLSANVERASETAKTTVMLHVSLLSFAVPIMPDVSGGVEYVEDPFVKVLYATKATPPEVLAFYRKELPLLGWTIPADGAPAADGTLELTLAGPEKEALRLELAAKGGLTHVLIAGSRK